MIEYLAEWNDPDPLVRLISRRLLVLSIAVIIVALTYFPLMAWKGYRAVRQPQPVVVQTRGQAIEFRNRMWAKGKPVAIMVKHEAGKQPQYLLVEGR